MFDFEQLHVYQEAMEMTEQIYAVTKDFPKDELYGMVSQLRRASLSIGLNIAEGKGRYHSKVYVQFLYQARGSLYETAALIRMSRKLGYIDEANESEFVARVESIAKKLGALVNSIGNKEGQGLD